METEKLVDIIAQNDPLLANAVSKMVGYIREGMKTPYPTKE